MLHSPFSSEKNWHRLYVPETLYEYFVARKYYDQEVRRDFVDLHYREDLLIALDSNDEFLDFWNMLQEDYPEKKDYFSSLTSEDEPYDPEWIECEYDSYMQETAFEELSEEEIRALKKEFDESRESAYQTALEAESRRLNCNIVDVKPMSFVLPWDSDHNEESKLANLPDQLFARVFQLLETLDIFNMTLVCKRWKRLIEDNALELKRAEHAIATHLIRFTDWMHSPETVDGDIVTDQHRMFSWCLMRWCCGVSENLEALILDHGVSYTKLADLLQSCHNLKHLRVGHDFDLDNNPFDVVPAQVRLEKLQTFISTPCLPSDCFSRPCRHLHQDILVSSPSLRVFKGC